MSRGARGRPHPGCQPGPGPCLPVFLPQGPFRSPARFLDLQPRPLPLAMTFNDIRLSYGEAPVKQPLGWVPAEVAVAGLDSRGTTRKRCRSSSVLSGERHFRPHNEAALLVPAEPGHGGPGRGRLFLPPRPPAPCFPLCQSMQPEGFLVCSGSGGLEAGGGPRGGHLSFPSSRGALGDVTARSRCSPPGAARPWHARRGGGRRPPLTFLQAGPRPRAPRHARLTSRRVQV